MGLMLRVLITGVSGFVGRHLTSHLREQAYDEIAGTVYSKLPPDPSVAALGVSEHPVDLCSEDEALDLLNQVRPRHIYHLAGQAFVPRSFEDPWETIENNIRGTLNLIRAIIALKLDTRLLVVSSGDVYGPVRPEELPLREDRPFNPTSPYAVSKVGQDMIALQYHLSHQVDSVRVRPFNQIGPGQSPSFVASAFARQIAAIEAGKQEAVIRVGNLEARRDFTDVRDAARAYHLLMTRGEAGQVYHLGSGRSHSIRDLLETLLSHARVSISTEADPALFRPIDVPDVVASIERIQSATGWKPQIAWADTLRDILDDWRQRVTTSL